MPDSKPEDHLVEAEFTEVDDDRQPLPMIDPKPNKPWGRIIFIALLASGVIYWVLHPHKPPLVFSVGWKELRACNPSTSLDGTKVIHLTPDQRVSLWDSSPIDGKESKKPIAEGKWEYEAESKYTIILNGESTSYSLVRPENESLCILIKGGIDAADLRASWFSAPD